MQVIINNDNCDNLFRLSAGRRFLVPAVRVICKQRPKKGRLRRNSQMNSFFPSISAAIAFGFSGAFAAEQVEKAHDYNGFTQIEVAGVFDLDVEVGPDYSIRLSGPSGEMEKVQATLKGETLILDRIDAKSRKNRQRRRNGVKAVITMPELNALEVSGVVDATIAGVDSADFSMNLSGVGEIEVAGRCDNFHANVSGVGELEARGLECRTVDVDISGVGEASVFAADAVDASVSGIGEITVYGVPASIRKEVGLFSKITIVE